VNYDPSKGGADSMAYQSYTENMTFRWAFICNACYRKATTVDEAKYAAFQRKEAEKLGM
jgi:hypothetical protein